MKQEPVAATAGATEVEILGGIYDDDELREFKLRLTLSASQVRSLEALAGSEGVPASGWLEDQLSAHVYVNDFIVNLYDELDTDPVTMAQTIMWNACRGEFSPWSMDVYSDENRRTEECFRQDIAAWAVPVSDQDRTVTEEEACWMREMGEAALALDGRRARELGDKLWKAWFDDQ